jgi:multicomponent K+:H+ antiporter subunit E
MMRRLLPHPVLSLVLAVVWMLLLNDLSPGALVFGLLLGWLIPLFTAPFWPEHVRIRRPLTLLRFVATVLWDILVANVAVARLILGRPGRLRPAFVEYPLTLRTELAISLLANTISLTPGTVSAYLSRDQRTLVIHTLDLDDPDDLVANIRQRYERPLAEVLES